MDSSYTYQLGTYRSPPYFCTVAVEPDWQPIENFAVTVHYRDRDGENVEVARIDTAHGVVHFDRLYRREQPTDFDVDLDYAEAEERLRTDWRRYARGCERAHGNDRR